MRKKETDRRVKLGMAAVTLDFEQNVRPVSKTTKRKTISPPVVQGSTSSRLLRGKSTYSDTPSRDSRHMTDRVSCLSNLDENVRLASIPHGFTMVRVGIHVHIFLQNIFDGRNGDGVGFLHFLITRRRPCSKSFIYTGLGSLGFLITSSSLLPTVHLMKYLETAFPGDKRSAKGVIKNTLRSATLLVRTFMQSRY